MTFETQGPEGLPAKQAKNIHPKNLQNERNLVQYSLIDRSSSDPADWIERFGKAYGDLLNEGGAFLELVKNAHKEDDPVLKSRLLTEIQRLLDEKAGTH